MAGLTRGFGPIQALRGVDLVLPRGRLAALVGPNGAGKTTLLRVLATLERADAGTVRVTGLDVRTQANAVRASIGFMGHRSLLYPDLTVEQNLAFFGRLYGVRLDDDAMTETLRDAGLARLRRTPVRHLSYGTVRRVALIRAMLHQPGVLLLDEPYSGLDPAAAARLDGALRRVAASGATVLLTSHDLGRAAGLADSVHALADGRVIWGGPGAALPDDVLRQCFGAATRWRRSELAPEPAGAQPAAPPSPALPPGAGAKPLGSLATSGAVLVKDIRGEVRAREILPVTIVFGLVVTVLMTFALTANVVEGGAIAGSLWAAVVFGSTLGLLRAAAVETEEGAGTGVRVAPVDRGAVFLGRWLSGLLWAALLSAVLLVATVVLARMPDSAVPGVALALAIGLPGWTAAGTLVAAMVAGVRARESLGPVILFPLVMPLLIAAARLAADAVEGHPPDPNLLVLAGAYDVTFVVLGWLAFGYVMEG